MTKQNREEMIVKPGDIYWIPVDQSPSLESDISHPHVVIQKNIDNSSNNTVIVCALTTNMKRTKSPGNVLLDVGEANLPKQSIVVVSQVSIVEKVQLGEYIGSLSEQRISQILAGMKFIEEMMGSR